MTVLVIDIGSSSARALLFDANAVPIEGAQVSRPYRFTTQATGAAVVEAEMLRGLVESCVDEILTHPAAAGIRVVGMCTFVGNVLGVDGKGRALTPIYTYADTRSAAEVAELSATVDAQAAHQRTGCRLHTAYLPARLNWLWRNEQALYSWVAFWHDFATYLYQHWFDQIYPTCSYSVASWSGLLNREHLTWDAEWLHTLGSGDFEFPQLADYNTLQQGLAGAYAERWSALRDVPFCLAVGDGAAANVGVGAVDAGSMALTVGTTAALRVVSDEKLPPVPSGLWSYRVDAVHHLIGGATSEGGNIFQWAAETFNLAGVDLQNALATRPADAHGLTFLPLLAGERAPGWATNASGTLHGLRLSTSPLDILQAALEGVALRLALIADQLSADPLRVLAGGGALAASPAWVQIIANALNRPLHLLTDGEVTARGTAILALRALTSADWHSFQLPPAKMVEPQKEDAAQLRAARERQQALYRQFYGD